MFKEGGKHVQVHKYLAFVKTVNQIGYTEPQQHVYLISNLQVHILLETFSGQNMLQKVREVLIKETFRFKIKTLNVLFQMLFTERLILCISSQFQSSRCVVEMPTLFNVR